MLVAVFDTNVLFSAVHNSGGVPGRFIDEWAAGAFELVVSERVLEELEEGPGSLERELRIDVAAPLAVEEEIEPEAIVEPAEPAAADVLRRVVARRTSS